MDREKKKISLRQVSENTDEDSPRVLRLHKDKVEVLDKSQTPEKIELKQAPEVRLEPSDRKKMKVRSAEADMTERNLEDEIGDLEEEWTEAGVARRIPLGWILLVASVFVAAVVWSLLQVAESEERSEVLRVETETALEQEEQEELDARETIATIKEVAEKFYAAVTIEEMLPLVRHPSRVKSLMEDYYSRYPMEPDRVILVSGLEPVTIGNHGGFWVVQTTRESGDEGVLLVEAKSKKEAKADWESCVRYQPIDWTDFVINRPGDYTGDFRVYAERDNFFSHEFADSEKYDCFRLTVLESDEVLFGYTLKNGSDAEQIDKIIDENPNGKAPMILKLHIPENINSRSGVLIRELVIQRWMFTKSPAREAP